LYWLSSIDEFEAPQAAVVGGKKQRPNGAVDRRAAYRTRFSYSGHMSLLAFFRSLCFHSSA
jgi:hypothetical protein